MDRKVDGPMSFIATWRAVWLLSLLCSACIAGFEIRSCAIHYKSTFDTQKSGYNTQEAVKLLTAMSADDRDIYAQTQLSLDLVFPLTYGCFFVGLIGLFWPYNIARLIVYFPIAMSLADILENILVAYFAQNFGKTSLSDSLIWIASTATVMKWNLLAFTLWFPIGCGAIVFLCRKIRMWLRPADSAKPSATLDAPE